MLWLTNWFLGYHPFHAEFVATIFFAQDFLTLLLWFLAVMTIEALMHLVNGERFKIEVITYNREILVTLDQKNMGGCVDMGYLD